MLASYWTSRFGGRKRKRREREGTHFLITVNPLKTSKDSRQEYENRFVAIRQSNLEQVDFQVDKYIC
jgi:hypothetical protein